MFSRRFQRFCLRLQFGNQFVLFGDCAFRRPSISAAASLLSFRESVDLVRTGGDFVVLSARDFVELILRLRLGKLHIA